MAVSTGAVLNALKNFPDPYLPKPDLVARGAIKNIEVQGAKVSFEVHLGYPAAGIEAQLKQDISNNVNW